MKTQNKDYIFAIIIIVLCIIIGYSTIKVNSLVNEVSSLRQQLNVIQRKGMPKTYSECKKEVSRINAHKWSLIKNKWLRIEDINNANWYESNICRMNITSEDWEKLIIEKAQDSLEGTWKTPASDLQLSLEYYISKDDIINALAEAAKSETVDFNGVANE